ncbi:MAG: hypothetical protein LBH91_05145 [Prevotellaceae bacterium]|jgi:hypothetical protein|nr:hypothetical protein [Prevotellaceae bacterium]
MKPVLLSSLLVLSYGTLYAQSNFKQGYIITNKNDTIVGLIDYRIDQMNAHICKFKKTETSPVETYFPGQIVGFRFTEKGRYYISCEIEIKEIKKTVFLEYLVQGMMNLYFYTDVITKLNYYIFESQNGEMRYITKKPDEFIKTADNKFLDTKYFIAKDIKYQSDIKNIFKDIPELKKETKDILFSHDAMISITKNYHYLTCTTGEACVEFVTRPDKHYTEYKFSAYGGVFASTIDGISHFFPIIGCRLNISVPKYYNSLGVTFDLSWTGHPLPISNPVKPSQGYVGFTTNQSLLSLMVGIRYTHHKGFIRPFIEGGVVLAYTKNAIIYSYAGWVDKIGSNGETYKVPAVLYDTINNINLSMGLNGSTGINFKVEQNRFIFFSAGVIYAANYLCNKTQLYPRLTLGYTF